MIDNIYEKSFREVDIILQNTDEELVKKIPYSFIKFIKNNMDKEYNPKIDVTIAIDKQPLLQETEAILSLIYRNYWMNEDEKELFKKLDEQNDLKEREKYKSIEQIFKEKNKYNIIKNVNDNNNLMVIEDKHWLKKIFKKFINKLIKR